METIMSIWNRIKSLFASNDYPPALTAEEKQQFWSRFDDYAASKKNNFAEGDFQRSRVEEAEAIIIKDDMKDVFEKRHDYAEQVREKNLEELIWEIQPRWRKRNSYMSESEQEMMVIAIMEYRLRGLDIEYFTNGFGSC